MRWFIRAMVAIVLVHVALTGYTIAKGLTKATPMPTTHTAPANWKYAAAREGHTFHSKGCPGLPKLPPEEMVYGNSVAEMLRVHDKEACPQCINKEGP